uniref:SFRICE_011677 n=1 Tax=Spodoptera frugiperda TaxID=7108 RepID=A0A2H1VG18_SPOFR
MKNAVATVTVKGFYFNSSILDLNSLKKWTSCGGFFLWYKPVNDQADHLMVCNHRRPWTLETPEASGAFWKFKGKKFKDVLPDGKQSPPPMDT